MRNIVLNLLVFIAFNTPGFGLAPMANITAAPQSSLTAPMVPILPASKGYESFQDGWYFDESAKSYSITSAIDQAPSSYFEKANTLEIYDQNIDAWIKVDKWALTRFKEAGFRGSHLQELFSLDISLEKAGQLIVQFTEEGLVRGISSPEEILKLIRFEAGFLKKSFIEPSIDFLACGFHLNFEGGISFAKARKLLELEVQGVDETLISQVFDWYKSRQIQTACLEKGICDYTLPGSDIEIDPITSGSKRVFKLSNFPQFIFKIVRDRFDENFIADSFEKRILAKKIAEDNGLDALAFPKLSTIDLNDNFKNQGDTKVVLIVEEMLLISNHSIYDQAELFKVYGDALNRPLAQLVTFMVKAGGLGDLHRSNLLILDNPTDQGNYQFGLIDLDHLTEGLIRGLTGNYQDSVGYNGYPNALSSHRGLLHFAASEGQLQAITNQLYQELGWPRAATYLWLSDFHTAVRQQRELIKREERLKQFHEERGLTDNRPLEVSLADIGLGFIGASRDLETLLEVNTNFMEKFTNNVPQFTENKFKNMFGNLTKIIAKIKSDTEHLKNSYSNLVNDDNFERLEKSFSELVKQINESLELNGVSGIVKQDRFIKSSNIREDELTLMFLDKLKENGYIFDFIHNGYMFIQL